jgi:ribokinase
MVGCVGQVSWGDALLENLVQAGVQTNYICRDAQTCTGVALITVDPQGQNMIVVAPEANSHLSPATLKEAEAAFQGAKVVVLQLKIPLEAVNADLGLAHYRSAKVILNPVIECARFGNAAGN